MARIRVRTRRASAERSRSDADGARRSLFHPVRGPARLGRRLVLAVVEHVGHDHDVRLVREALGGEPARLLDGVEARLPEVDRLPALAALAGERALDPLRPGVVEEDAHAPGERVADADRAPDAVRLRDGALEVAVAFRVDRPAVPPVGAHGGIPGPRAAGQQEAHRPLGDQERDEQETAARAISPPREARAIGPS